MTSLLRLKPQQKDFLKYTFRIHVLHFASYSFGIETTNTLIRNRSSFVNHNRFQTKMSKIKIYPFSDQTSSKTLPLGAAHTYMAYIREYPPPGEIVKTRHPEKHPLLSGTRQFCI